MFRVSLLGTAEPNEFSKTSCRNGHFRIVFKLSAIQDATGNGQDNSQGTTYLAIAIARTCIRSSTHGCYSVVVDLVVRLEAETRGARRPSSPITSPVST